MPSVDGGCILLARRFFTSWIWNLPHHQRVIALWLIYRAHWKREPRKIATSRGPIVLERGQLWTTRRQIAKECGVTPKQARGTLTILERNGFFRADRRAGLGMVVTICNYDRYQDTNNYKRPTTGPTEGRPRADPGPHSESGNQGNQEKETPSTYRPGLTPSLQKRRELVIRYGPEKGAEEYRKWVRGKSDKEMFG